MKLGFVLGLIFVFLIGGAVFLSVYFRKKHKIKNAKISVIAAAVIAVMFVFLPFSIRTVQAGEVAVVKVWGEAKEIRTAGTYFDFWLSKQYQVYDSKVQQIDIDTMAYSSDGQTMDIQMIVQAQIQSDKAKEIANNFGDIEMLLNRIKAVSIEKAKAVLSTKNAMTIITSRSEVSPLVEENIKQTVSNGYYVDIITVVITNIDFTDAFEQTVEQKMIAEQEKLKAEYEKEKAIIEAEKALEVAKLDAQAKIAEAEGNAKAQIEIASAEAESIRLKSIEAARLLGFEIIDVTDEDGKTTQTIDFTVKSDAEINTISEYLKYIEYLNTWDGKLPEVVAGDNTGILVTPGGDTVTPNP